MRTFAADPQQDSTIQVRHIPWLYVILGCGLLLRTAYALSLDPTTPFTGTGGDTAWYLEYGRLLVSGGETGPLTPPPLYLLFVGIPQLFLSPEASAYAIRLLQVLASTATCYFASRIAGSIGGRPAAIVGAALLAFNPIFIMESGQISSETLYLFFLSAALMLTVRGLKRNPSNLRDYVSAGIVFALATLTRAALLAFPIGIVIHLALAYRPRRALQYALALLVVFALVLSPWTIYYKLRWDRWIIAGEGLEGFLYLGAADWQGPFETDAQLDALTGSSDPLEPRDDQYIDATATLISRDISGYVARRVSEWGSAYLTPHGVHWFPGESLRALASQWMRDDFTPDGFMRLVQGDAFFPKLMFYIIHYAGIVLGVLGIWATRRQWRLTLPMIGFIAYVTLMHLVLFALPRYIFPATLVFWVFAALWLGQRLTARHHSEDDRFSSGTSTIIAHP